MIKKIDFNRSFITFQVNLDKKRPITLTVEQPFTVNNARIQIDSICRVTNNDSNQEVTFSLTRSCKTEAVNVEKDFWTQPNADMCMVGTSDGNFMILKSWNQIGKEVKFIDSETTFSTERQIDSTEKVFSHYNIHHKETIAKELDLQDIISTTLNHEVLIGTTVFNLNDTYEVYLEYPIITINVSEEHQYYQVDTGALLFPDIDLLSGIPDISIMRRAYIAHKKENYAELILETPTLIKDNLKSNHFSKIVPIKCLNKIYQIL